MVHRDLQAGHADGAHRFVEGTGTRQQTYEAPPRHGLRQRLGLRDLRTCTAERLNQPVHHFGKLLAFHPELPWRSSTAERDAGAREDLADGFRRWEGHLRAGLDRMQASGRLSATADPARLAIATMALLQGGLLLTQVRRDPKQLRTALAAARVLLRSAAA